MKTIEYDTDRFTGPDDSALVRDHLSVYRIDTQLEGLAAIASAIFKLAQRVDDLDTTIRRAAK